MSQGDVVCLFKNRKEAEDFVEFVLTDEATRPVRRGYPQTLPLRGKHVTYGQGKSRYRGTDRRERVYVAVSALEHVGQTIAPACRGGWEACWVTRSAVVQESCPIVLS